MPLFTARQLNGGRDTGSRDEFAREPATNGQRLWRHSDGQRPSRERLPLQPSRHVRLLA
jgi:hypothetical protein